MVDGSMEIMEKKGSALEPLLNLVEGMLGLGPPLIFLGCGEGIYEGVWLRQGRGGRNAGVRTSPSLFGHREEKEKERDGS